MLDEKMIKAMNAQFNGELYSAYLYVAMAAYFDSINLKGFSNWMKVQVQEELVHAQKIYDFLINSNAKIVFTEIQAPKNSWDLPLAVFEATYRHEVEVTKNIHQLFKLATDLNDYPSISFLKWFIDEQVEEESNAKEALEKLKLIGKDTSALFILNQELGSRVFTPPANKKTQ